MPPENAGKPLTPEQVGVLRAWIDQGAKWPDDLSRRGGADVDSLGVQAAGPARRCRRSRTPAWVRNPIDAFVLARLEKEGLEPSPEADRATLIRRAEPRPDRPAADDRRGRCLRRRHVARRLRDGWSTACSPRRTTASAGRRRWLDRARYADTNGYEKDRERSIWPYRDWVIRRPQPDMPFDRFTIEQIAGDLLPGRDARPEDRHRLPSQHDDQRGRRASTSRSSASPRSSIASRTTGTVWLGLTIELRPVPHAQVRPDHPARVLPASSPSSNNADEPELDRARPGDRGDASEDRGRDRGARARPGREPSRSTTIRTGGSRSSRCRALRRRGTNARSDAGRHGRRLGQAGRCRHLSPPTFARPRRPDLRDPARDVVRPEAQGRRTRSDEAWQLRRLGVQGRGRPGASGDDQGMESRSPSQSASADVEQPEFPAALAIDGKRRQRLGDRRRLGPHPRAARGGFHPQGADQPSAPTDRLRHHDRPALRRRAHARPVPDLGQDAQAGRGRTRGRRRTPRGPDLGQAG